MLDCKRAVSKEDWLLGRGTNKGEVEEGSLDGSLNGLASCSSSCWW